MSLPLPGPETVSLAARPAALAPAGPYPVLGVAEVRLLGLRDGQIVRPTVEVRNERLALLLDGRLVEWPGATPSRTAAGPDLAAATWVVRLLANGSAHLVPVRTRDGAPAPPAGTAQAPRPDPPTMAAGPAPDRPGGLPSRWAQLLLRPGPWTAWTAALWPALADTPVPAGLSAAGTTTRAALPWVVPLLPTTGMGLLDGASLREAVRRCGLFAESKLARGECSDLSDVKLALLARLRGADAGAGAAPVVLSSALEDVEAAQVQSLASSTDGNLILHFALGFRDAPPLSLRLARDTPRTDGTAAAESGWTVDIHSQSDTWGPLWLQTRVEADGRVGLVMWTERADVCDAARADAERLADVLRDEGLRLDRFQVVHGPRPEPPAERTAARAGAVLDLRA